MKKMNKIISSISAAALVFGSVSSYVAFASAGDTEAATEVATAADLVAAINNGGNVKLTADIELSAKLAISQNAVIDLNGHALTVATTAIGIGIGDNATVTIKNGDIKRDGNAGTNYLIDVGASWLANSDGYTGRTLTLENVNVTDDNGNGITSINNRGTLTITGGEYNLKATYIKGNEFTTTTIGGGANIARNATTGKPGSTVYDEAKSGYPAIVAYGKVDVTDATVSGAVWALAADEGAKKYASEVTIGEGAEVSGSLMIGADYGAATTSPKLNIEEGAVVDAKSIVWTSEDENKTAGTNAIGELNINGGEISIGKVYIPEEEAATLTIDEDVDVTLGDDVFDVDGNIDEKLAGALQGVENITDSEGKLIEVSEDGTVAEKKFEVNKAVVDDGVGGGSVTVSGTSEAAGATVTITVTPDENSALTDLTVSRKDDSTVVVDINEENDGTYSFTMPAYDVLVRAEFAREYTISSENVKGVDMVATTADKATAGTEITVVVAPTAGYAVDKITYTVDGGEPGEITGGKFTMPAGNVTIIPVVSELAPDEYSVTVTNTDTNGTVTVDKTSAAAGTEITVTAAPDEGYELEAITVMNGTEKVTVTNGKFTMPAGNVTVSATFKEVPKENKPADDDKKPGDGDDKPADDDKKPGDGDDKPANDNKPGDGDDNKPTEPGGSDKDNTGDNNNDGDGNENHGTGIALAVAPVLLAGSAVAVAAIKKKTK